MISLVFVGVDCRLGIYVFREEVAQGMGIGFLYGHSSHSAVSLLHIYHGLLAYWTATATAFVIVFVAPLSAKIRFVDFHLTRQRAFVLGAGCSDALRLF